MANEIVHLPSWKLLLLAVVLLRSLVAGQTVDNEQSHSTSVAGMVQLLELEAKLIDNLNNYADELELKLKVVRRLVNKALSRS